MSRGNTGYWCRLSDGSKNPPGGQGGPVSWPVSTMASAPPWPKNTSFLNALKHPQAALCIAPPVPKFSKGFVNTSLLHFASDLAEVVGCPLLVSGGPRRG